MIYEVICENIGTVYSGSILATAIQVYREYIEQSDSGYGRASNEDITLLCDGEPIRSHYANKPVNNDCDGNGPHTTGEVKLLASGGCANLILCHACFVREIAFRKSRNTELGRNVFELPAWETLKPYEY
jgi:hypothetical protein